MIILWRVFFCITAGQERHRSSVLYETYFVGPPGVYTRKSLIHLSKLRVDR